MRDASLQLRDRDAAEEAVDETLAGALQARERFSGASSARTWVTGILKHKMIDHVRKQLRERPLTMGGGEDRSEAEAIDALIGSLFHADGHWREPPSDRGNPHKALQNQALLATFEQCATNLPAKASRASMMREVLEQSTEGICKKL